MASHLLDHLNDSRVWEAILVTTLSLCSFSICSCIFFFSSIIVHHRFGQIAVFLVSVARDRLRVELELRIMISRLFLAILLIFIALS